MVKTCTDITGQKFGRLTVIKRVFEEGYKKPRWLCQCDCGNTCVVLGESLKSGNTQSCGCLQKERSIASCKTHGLRRQTKLYPIWSQMKQRCQNPNNAAFENYGGRGIVVCDEWLKFKTFYDWAMNNGYSEGLCLDRIDNDKGYSPDNCRWVSHKMNNDNRRSTIRISFNGETHTLKEWSEILNIERHILYKRIYVSNWSIEDAFNKKV